MLAGGFINVHLAYLPHPSYQRRCPRFLVMALTLMNRVFWHYRFCLPLPAPFLSFAAFCLIGSDPPFSSATSSAHRLGDLLFNLFSLERLQSLSYFLWLAL